MTIHWWGGRWGYKHWGPWCVSNPSLHPLPWWIVILSPGCTHNVNKDGACFCVRVQSWQSYGKIEDCKQSKLNTVDFSHFTSLPPSLHSSSMRFYYLAGSALILNAYGSKFDCTGLQDFQDKSQVIFVHRHFDYVWAHIKFVWHLTEIWAENVQWPLLLFPAFHML